MKAATLNIASDWAACDKRFQFSHIKANVPPVQAIRIFVVVACQFLKVSKAFDRNQCFKKKIRIAQNQIHDKKFSNESSYH